MINIFAITFNLLLSVLMLALITWFEQEEIKITVINQEHQEDIKKLQKIAQINSWLKDVVQPMIKVQPSSSEEANEYLIKYFDENFIDYNLLIKKYLYEDEGVKNIDLSYKINTNDIDKLIGFVKMEYKNGFLEFKELTMDDKGLTGVFQLIQPYQEDDNASN